VTDDTAHYLLTAWQSALAFLRARQAGRFHKESQSMHNEFSRKCDAVLRSTLPAPLAAAIRRLLEAGETPETVLALFENAGATQARMVGLAVEAEVEAIAAEIQARRN
jgi:hypothetical protein